jgi:hypothetical protein
LSQAREEVKQAEAEVLRLRQAEIRLRYARERLKLAEAENQARLGLAQQALSPSDSRWTRQYTLTGPGDLDTRVSALEKKLDDVLREVQGLRKEWKPASPPPGKMRPEQMN